MKTFAKIKQWLIGGCVWYALISLLFILIDLIASGATHGISSLSFLLFFPFGLCMSAAGMIYKSKLPRWSRILLHYVITVLAFLLCLILPTGSLSSGVYVLLMLVLLSAIYWALFPLVHILNARWKRVLEED